jgi:hypothetical protein
MPFVKKFILSFSICFTIAFSCRQTENKSTDINLGFENENYDDKLPARWQPLSKDVKLSLDQKKSIVMLLSLSTVKQLMKL